MSVKTFFVIYGACICNSHLGIFYDNGWYAGWVFGLGGIGADVDKGENPKIVI